MSDKAFVTPKILKWARESARMSLESAASKISVSSEKLEDWEEGISHPTIKQAESLAKAYRRPFAIFFLPEIPRDFQTLQDFRRQTAKKLGTASIFIIREIQQKQNWISELYSENEESPLSFVGKYSIKSSAQNVAKDILATLEIDPLHYFTENPIREWITKAEAKGIFISRTSFIHTRLKLDSEELQGFAISDKFAPFIFINSEDWNAPQLFTLVHELAHIWIAASGISNDIEPELKHKDKLHPIELFCNEVAANALLPTEIMENFDHSVFNSSKDIFSISKKLGVSSFTFLYRAFSLDLISLDKYKKLKKQADEDFQAFLLREEEKANKTKEKKKGGPDYFMLLVNKNSHLFTKVVMDAFRGGYIQPTQASTLLNTQVNNFSKLEAFLYK
ncbi:ImmA/IrrE family metallo-endopeptidase [Ginsengibacter hankyongi]|uniref:ImmA/IrrE family metallo-endopeptidase n=1 Tax=Ginsengibacter hankyongi TaxID=2607284 RepID=A0A5J5ILQ0_9BACT|nr:XRE family transcriptional regulator [Ginsengibacter hankyongi]KAA9042006.1 ImmA/IrrE family metallo-endopeptidase [Ginsengibacter hankyongi]